MLSIFILCAGNGHRWNDFLGIPKQLLAFGKERLIDRTARIVSSKKESNLYCVTNDTRISLDHFKTILISKTNSLPETILTTEDLWSDRNVFLLGDVFYSEGALDSVLNCRRSLAFFGRPWPSAYVNCGHGELFGFTFAATSLEEVHGLLVTGLSVCSNDGANLWTLYQLAGGLPLRSSRYVPELLVPIDDYTNDIDTPSDYKRRYWLYQKITLKGPNASALVCRNIALCPAHYLGLFRWRVGCLYETLHFHFLKKLVRTTFTMLAEKPNAKVGR